MRRRSTTARRAVYVLTRAILLQYKVHAAVCPCFFCSYLWFTCEFSLCFQPKDSKKEREPDRGSKVSPYTKVSLIYSPMNRSCTNMLLSIVFFLFHTHFVVLIFICSFHLLWLFLKNEESRPVPKISPSKTSEPSVNLLGLGECLSPVHCQWNQGEYGFSLQLFSVYCQLRSFDKWLVDFNLDELVV